MHPNSFTKGGFLSAVALALLIIVSNAAADLSEQSLSATATLGREQSSVSWNGITVPSHLPPAGEDGLVRWSRAARQLSVTRDPNDFVHPTLEVDRALNDALLKINDESDSAFFPRYGSLETLSLKNEDMTMTGSGTVVLRLDDFVLVGGTLTLQGTAETKFVIKVRDTFSLSHSAQIVLAGGLQCANVVFHVIGRGDYVSVRQQSTLAGIIEAPQRWVSISGKSTVIGQVTTKWAKLSGDSVIIPPPIVSP